MYQIGDWVCITPEESLDGCPVLKQIKEIVGRQSHYRIGRDLCPEKHLAPIPLTDEILERNGFILESDSIITEEDDYCFWYKDELCPNEDFCITKYNGIVDYYDFYNFHIRYVHELQQAMRLWFTCNAEGLSAEEYEAIIDKIR